MHTSTVLWRRLLRPVTKAEALGEAGVRPSVRLFVCLYVHVPQNGAFLSHG